MTFWEVMKKFSGADNEDGFKERYKQAEQNYRIKELVEQRKKNSNERELERYYEEERQKRIKQELDNIRKKKSSEFWSGKQNNILNTPNMFKEESYNHILKQKNIFSQGDNMFMK